MVLFSRSRGISVALEDSSEVRHLDARSLKIAAAWSLAARNEPTGLAIDVAHHRLFSVCDNDKMAILDSQSGQLASAVPIGAGADAVAYDASRGLVCSSNACGGCRQRQCLYRPGGVGP